MYLLLILSVVSFLVSFALTPPIRDWCLRSGLVDRPDQKRKTHARAVPRVGGIPIAIAYLGCFLLSMLPQLGGSFSFGVGLPLALRFAPAVAVIFATGLLDDLRGLTPRQKLAGQFLAAFLAYGAGVHLNRAVGFQFPLWVAFPATLIWLVGCSNAFNLIDGIDGLAAGVGLFATVTTLMAALLNHHYELAMVTVPLMGALLGFFPYNFSRASIFLGDSGSLLIGFLLGAYGVLWSDKSATLLGMTAPLMAVAIPLCDAALAILRRFLRGQPIWAADRGHIHHRLLDRGLSPKRVVMVLYGVCGIGAALSLLLDIFQASFGGLIIVLFCAGAWLGIHGLGFVEFGIAGTLIRNRAFQKLLNAHAALRSFETALSSAPDLDACWKSLVELSLRNRQYWHCLAPSRAGAWTIIIPLSERDQVTLHRNAAAGTPPLIARLADIIRDVLSRRLPDLLAAEPQPGMSDHLLPVTTAASAGD